MEISYMSPQHALAVGSHPINLRDLLMRKKKNKKKKGKKWGRERDQDTKSSRQRFSFLSKMTDPSPADSVINVQQDEVGAPSQTRNRLLEILNEDKKISKEEVEEEQIDVSDAAAPKDNFFQRGQEFIRNSMRKISKLRNSIRTESSKKTHKTGGNSDSQDSGLGEDSDLENEALRTSTPIEKSILTTSSSWDQSQPNVVTKKHVVIKEPSRRSITRYSQFHQRARIIDPPRHIANVVRILPSASQCRLPKQSGRQASRAVRVGNVRNQWQKLLSMARFEVIKFIDCDVTVVNLIFDANHERTECAIHNLQTSDQVAQVIHVVYKIIYFDWLRPGCSEHLSIILHSVQKFLIITVDVAELDMEEKIRFARLFRALLSNSVESRYRNLPLCLDNTRKLYIDFWCCLLCTPFQVV